MLTGEELTGWPSFNPFRVSAHPVVIASQVAAFFVHIFVIFHAGAEEVVRPTDTRRVIATMENAHILWDWADLLLVGYTMHEQVRATSSSGADLSVPLLVFESKPYPAWAKLRTMRGNGAVLIDPRPQAFTQRARSCGTGAPDATPAADTLFDLMVLRSEWFAAKFTEAVEGAILGLHREPPFSLPRRPDVSASRACFVPVLYHKGRGI